MANPLKVTLVQSTLHWQQPEANRAMFRQKIESMGSGTDVIVLPEMFTTGFSMQPQQLAETMQGETVQWMQQMAQRTGAAITGSIMCLDHGRYHNRLLWAGADGQLHWYDKRHLFALSGEHEVYTAGRQKLLVDYKGWRIFPLICYDLRFPVWCRNGKGSSAYDILMFVANWPARRAYAWQQLLIARAIENQCYVVGVNRVGNDGNNIYHNGCSALVSPTGEVLYQKEDSEDTITLELDYSLLANTRKQLPFLRDADDFTIHV